MAHSPTTETSQSSPPTHQEHALQLPSRAHRADEIQRRQLRMCFFLVLTLWTLAAMVTPVAVFCVTGSPLSFSFFSALAPPVYLWYRFAKYVLMDEWMFELEMRKIQGGTEKPIAARAPHRDTG